MRLEQLEERTLLAVNPGMVVVGPSLPTDPATGLRLNMLYGRTAADGSITNQTQVGSTGFATGVYQAPGSNAQSNPPYNINQPFIVNGSPSFNQAAQSSDWWSNLMFRTDPITVTGASFSYGNRYLFSEPAVLKFQNNQFNAATGDWVQGLSIFNPDTFGITPDPQGPSATTNRGFGVYQATPLTLGIGSGQRITAGASNPGIAPLDDPNPTNPNGPDEARLLVRVNHYSDWGVQVSYGDGNPDQPSTQNNSLTIDMTNGRPFIDFTKKGTAPADLWLTPFGAGGTNQIWGKDIPGLSLPDNVLGVTSTVNWTDAAGVTHENVSSYLVIAQSGSWQLAPNYTASQPDQPRILTNTGIADGKIVVVLLPHMVGQTPFVALPAADQVNIARMFSAPPASSPATGPVAFNFPASNSSSTQVSAPTAHQETYDGQTVTFGYDPFSSTVTTKYTVTTDNGQPTDQLLYPAQYDNLLASDQQNFLTYSLNGVNQPLEYLTESGTAKLYSSPTNTFATRLTYSGILPYLPSTAEQTDPAAAQALYGDAAQWFNSYLQAPDAVIGPTENTYMVGLTLLGEQLMIIDQLASPTSLLSSDQHATAASWRDRILQDLESTLFSWFDTSTGRFFQLNTKYDTVIGYPAGFGSDFSLNDHNFHYGYFLDAFAAVAQFDPDFVTALVPQLTLLIDDVANWSRTDPSLPFLREFNPWMGHSWADGLGQGGNNMESIAESIQFDSALARLGMLLGNQSWSDMGVYLYTTEMDSETEYWFNANAQPDQGNYGNWPQEFVQYNLNSTPTVVTQIANPRQTGPDRALFFSDPNYAEGVYGINWLPVSAQTLYLGRDQAYLERNWAQFVQDYNAQTPVPSGVYQLLVATYQSLLPDDGVGVDQPGPSNALLRIDPAYNPAIIPPAPDNLVNNGYRGTTRTQVLNWIDTLQQLGQVDPTVIADAPSYAAFIKDGQRTFVAYNPTDSVLPVTFRDAQSGAVLSILTVQPGEMLTQLGSGQLITDHMDQSRQSNQGTNLYLLSTSGQNSLGAQPGTGVPDPNGNPLDIATYKNTFADVPANSNGTDTYPGEAKALTFVSGPINGLPVPGGKTEFQLFLDNVLTWNNAPAADPIYGRQYGPGVVQNKFLRDPNVNIEIDYQYNNSTGQTPTFTDRVEWYTAKLQPNNEYVLYDTTVPDPAVSYNQNFDPANLVNQPLQPMVDGRVRVRIWGGAVTAGMTPKDFAISVNTVPEMARTSRLILPYVTTDANGKPDVPLTVTDVSPVAPVRRANPVDSVTVTLSGPAASQGFTSSALTLTLNGGVVPLGTGVTIVPVSGATYTIEGLAAVQTQPGTYLLSIDASKISNPAGQAGSGTSSVNWFLDQSPPLASLFTTAVAPAQATPIPVTVLFNKPVSGFGAGGVLVGNALITNFRGSGNLYSFDLTPTSSVGTVTASVPAGTVHDAAGNANTASATLSIPVAIAGPTVLVSSPASGGTNQSQIPITVKFSGPVTIPPGALLKKILVTGGVLTVGPATVGDGTYTFNLSPTAADPATVVVQVPAAAAQDGAGRFSSAAAPFSVTFDNTPPTATLTSADSPGTFQSPIPVTVRFSKPVTGLDVSGLSVVNANIVNFAGSGNSYSFDLIPLGIGPVTAQVKAGAARDAAGNANTASGIFSRVFQVNPVASLYSPAGQFTDSTNVPIYVQFNEPVRLDPGAVSVVQGKINDTITQISPTTYLFHVTPQLASGQQSTTVTVTVAQLAATDAFGVASQQSYSYRFTYSSYSALQGSLKLLVGPAAYDQVSLTFNQPFVSGFDASKVVLSPNARISALSGGGNFYVFWVTAFPLPADYGKPATLTVTVPPGAVTGADGLPVPNAVTLSIDVPRITGPTAVVTSDQTHDNWTSGPIPMDVSFSEEVTGFSANLLTASPGATVSNLQQSSQDPTRYTFDLTPAANMNNVSVGVAPGGIVGKNSSKPLMATPTVFTRNFVAGPVVTSVSSSYSGVANPGDLVPITVTFSAPVIVDASQGVPSLLLNAVGPAGSAAASYVSGGSADGTSSTLVFNFVVQAGQRIGHLDYRSSGALTSQGQTTLIQGSILDAKSQNPISTPVLFDPGQSGSLAANSQISVGAAPTGVTLVASTLSNGTYATGQVIPITVEFNNPVTVDTTGGTPTLALDVTGGTGTAAAQYASGSGTDTLTFNFTPVPGQSSAALDYSSSAALSTNGGMIRVAGQNTLADLTLPPPGTTGSLGRSRVLAIAGHASRVIAAWDDQTNQTVGAGGVIKIFVTLDGPVTVDTTGGQPTLTLTLDNNKTATAVYQPSLSGTSLEFDYTVAIGDQSAKLDYGSVAALATNGAIVHDALGQNADLSLPAPGTSGSLRSNNTTVAGDPPHVVSVTALSSNGGYGLDASGTVNASVTIQVTFSSLVNVDTTKGYPTLVLNSGAKAVATYNSLVDKTLPILNFIYAIGANQSTPHLDYSSITALELNGGAITDQRFGQVAAILTLSAPGSAASLAGSSSLAVETDKNATPFVADVTSTAVNGTYGVGRSLPIVVTLGLPVTVTGMTQLQLLLANGQTALANYSSGSGNNVLTFTFNVSAGQGTPRLDDGGFLVLNGSTKLPLPAPGAAGSLGRNTRIAIDTSAAAPPSVQAVTAGVPDGQYRTGDAIPIQVQFSRPVLVTGQPQLALSTGGTNSFPVNYSGGSGTDTLTFLYTIGAGQKSPRLDYASTAALSISTGSAIADALNQQPAILTLPVPGLAGSLSETTLLVVGNPQQTTLIRPLTTTTMLDGLSRVFAGQEFTLTADVSSAVAGDTLNAGSVTFLDGSTVLGTVPVTGGVASLTLQLSPGNHLVHAVFAGDPLHQGSASGSQEIRVDELVVKRSSIVDRNGVSGAVIRRFFPYGRTYFGGLSVAAADLNGDGISDIVAAPARGPRTRIKVFDGRTGKLVRSIVAFHGVPHRGVQVSTGDVNGDGIPDLLAQSRGRHARLVEYFDGRTGLPIGKIQKLPLPAGPAALRRR